MFIYFWEREREHVSREGAERERKRISSKFVTVSSELMWGSNSRTVRSRPEPKSSWILNQLSHPGAPPTIFYLIWALLFPLVSPHLIALTSVVILLFFYRTFRCSLCLFQKHSNPSCIWYSRQASTMDMYKRKINITQQGGSELTLRSSLAWDT